MGQRRTGKQVQQKRKDNPQEWSTKKKIIIFYTVLMVIYGFYTMIISIVAFANFTDSIQAYEQIVANLEKEPIVDIQSRGSSSCATGYESLFFYDWAGTKAGCNCINAPNTNSYSNVNRQLYEGACNTNQTKAGCNGVSSVSGKEFEFFDINNVQNNVCVKRLKGKPYYKNAPKSADCGSKKSCGIATVPESIYCVEQNEECPIYDIQFGSINDNNLNNNDYTEIQLQRLGSVGASTQSVYYKRTGDDRPISEIQVTEGAGVCYNNEQLNIESGHTEYKLMQKPRKLCSKTDPRFEAMTNGDSSNGEQKLYTINGVYAQLSNLPGFTASDNHVYKSYSRDFIEWDINKRDELEKVVDMKDKIDSMKTSQGVVMGVNIMVCIVVSIFLTICQVYNLAGKDVPCISGDGEAEQKRIKWIKKVCQYGAKALQLPFCLWAFILASSTRGFLTKLANDQVSEELTNEALDDLAKEINTSVYRADLMMFISLLLVTLVDIALYVRKRMKKSQKKKNKTQQINPEVGEGDGEQIVSGGGGEEEVKPPNNNTSQQILQPPQQQYQQPNQIYTPLPPGQPPQQNYGEPQQPPPGNYGGGELPPQTGELPPEQMDQPPPPPE